MAHLGECIDLARRRGHRVIGLVYDQALSGGFITIGPDRRCLLRAAGGRDPGDAPAGDGARDQAARGEADGAVAIQPGVRAGGAELRGDGRRRALWEGDLAACLAKALAAAGLRRPPPGRR